MLLQPLGRRWLELKKAKQKKPRHWILFHTGKMGRFFVYSVHLHFLVSWQFIKMPFVESWYWFDKNSIQFIKNSPPFFPYFFNLHTVQYLGFVEGDFILSTMGFITVQPPFKGEYLWYICGSLFPNIQQKSKSKIFDFQYSHKKSMGRTVYSPTFSWFFW